MKCRCIAISVCAVSGPFGCIQAEDIKALKEWIEPIAKSGGAQVLVTAGADGFKAVADEIGVEHQICKVHGLRNSSLKALLAHKKAS